MYCKIIGYVVYPHLYSALRASLTRKNLAIFASKKNDMAVMMRDEIAVCVVISLASCEREVS